MSADGPRCSDDYLAWLLAFEHNLTPFDSLKSENTDIGGDEHMVLLASKLDSTNILVIYDQAWE